MPATAVSRVIAYADDVLIVFRHPSASDPILVVLDSDTWHSINLYVTRSLHNIGWIAPASVGHQRSPRAIVDYMLISLSYQHNSMLPSNGQGIDKVDTSGTGTAESS